MRACVDLARSLGRFTTVGCLLAATLVARCGGDHGVGADGLTVWEKRGEEERRGEGRRGVLGSRRVAIYLF